MQPKKLRRMAKAALPAAAMAVAARAMTAATAAATATAPRPAKTRQKTTTSMMQLAVESTRLALGQASGSSMCAVAHAAAIL